MAADQQAGSLRDRLRDQGFQAGEAGGGDLRADVDGVRRVEVGAEAQGGDPRGEEF